MNQPEVNLAPPTVGGIFLSLHEHDQAAELTAELPYIKFLAEEARKELDEILPANEPRTLGWDLRVIEDHCRAVKSNYVAQEMMLIDNSTMDTRISRKALYSKGIEGNKKHQRQVKRYLEAVNRPAVYAANKVVPDYTPPNYLREAMIGYREHHKGQAGLEADAISRIRQLSEKCQRRLLETCLGFGVENLELSGNEYSIAHTKQGIAYLIERPERGATVHFMDMQLGDYTHDRIAGTNDHVRFLQACLNTKEGRGLHFMNGQLFDPDVHVARYDSEAVAYYIGSLGEQLGSAAIQLLTDLENQPELFTAPRHDAGVRATIGRMAQVAHTMYVCLPEGEIRLAENRYISNGVLSIIDQAGVLRMLHVNRSKETHMRADLGNYLRFAQDLAVLFS